MNNSEISIIIPVYNIEEKLLRKCIDSCIGQTKSNIEIIVVDDCSHDITASICDEYAARDNRITVIHKRKNEGLAAARNSGVYCASSEWIMFLDGDDWIEKDTCELVDGIKDVDLIFFGMCRDYKNKQTRLLMPYKDGQFFDYEGCKRLQVDILDYHKRLSTAYCKFVKRAIVEKYSIYHDETVRCGVEGIEFNLRLFGKINSALYRGKYKYHYVYNTSSITGAPSDSTNMYILSGLRQMKKYIDTVSDNRKLKEQLEKRTQRILLDTAVGSYFNPSYKMCYSVRKARMKHFMESDIIKSIIQRNEYYEQSLPKRMIYNCVVRERYAILFLVGVFRYMYLRFR